jgi:hypothetical protein
VEQGLEPNDFSGSGSKGAIFGFSAGAGNCPLFARGPGNKIGAKKDTETTSEFSVIRTASPVSV